MECCFLQQHQQMLLPPSTLINPATTSTLSKLKPTALLSSYFKARLFCSSKEVIPPPNGKPKSNVEVLKENWLSSLSWVSSLDLEPKCGLEMNNNGGPNSNWVIGVDPDVSGALAILKPHLHLGFTAEVFDSPYVQVSVGKTRRRRLDARSIVQLVQSIGAPAGTTAYLEQSTPFPRDGKQGWWSGGFGYGLWIGILVASGFTVIPVTSNVWKKEFELAGSRSSKVVLRPYSLLPMANVLTLSQMNQPCQIQL